MGSQVNHIGNYRRGWTCIFPGEARRIQQDSFRLGKVRG